MRLSVALAALLALGCGGDDEAHVVHVPAGLAGGAQFAVQDLITDLSFITGERFVQGTLPVGGCRDGEIHVAYLGHRHHEDGSEGHSGLGGQEYTIDEVRCGFGRKVVLAGGSLLSGQWAAYDLLHRLGVRYNHPEQTLYPRQASWPVEPLAVRETPAFINRSLHVPRDRPVELSAPLAPQAVNMSNHQRRWIDWNIKQRHTHVDGWDTTYADTYAYQRGFDRVAALDLLTDDHGDPALDSDDPRPETIQISEAMQQRLAPVDELPEVTRLDIHFADADLTAADDVLTVQRLSFIADYARDNFPGVEVFATNHGIHQDPGPNYMVRFFDLPEFAPGQLGARVRTLMFYDLERGAAGVYGNADFSHLGDWIAREVSKRRIVHGPQTTWWRTFDIAVPLYLAPVTLDARQNDIDALAPHLQSDQGATTGVWGHRQISGGQEWGYWLVDYCVARMAWNPAFSRGDCLDDFTSRLADGDEIRAVLEEVTTRQVGDLRDPELVRFLVGSDDEAEAAPLHPLAPDPAEVLGWSNQQIDDLARLSLTPLARMATDYHAWADRIEVSLAMQSEAQAPWVREIRDGLRIIALRAAHAVEIYTTALALRSATDEMARQKAREGLDRAKLLTEQARALIVGREQDYRYHHELTIAGDESGTPGAVANAAGTTYRYLSRTHRVYYWSRTDQRLEALFD